MKQILITTVVKKAQSPSPGSDRDRDRLCNCEIQERLEKICGDMLPTSEHWKAELKSYPTVYDHAYDVA